MFQVTIHVLFLINVVSNVAVEVTSGHDLSTATETVQVHADGSVGLQRQRDKPSHGSLSKRKDVSVKLKSWKPAQKSRRSSEDKAWRQLERLDRRRESDVEHLEVASREDPLFGGDSEQNLKPGQDWELPNEKWTSALVPETGWGKEAKDETAERQSARRLVRNADTSTLATMVRVGEGVGPITYSRSPGAHQSLNRELRQRLVAQDMATIFFLLFILAIAIWTSCLGVFQFADDPSQVEFYTDPRHTQHRVTCSSRDMDSFLEAFNTQPRNATLRLIGRSSTHRTPSWWRWLPGTASGPTLRRWTRRLLPGRRRPAMDGVMFHVALDLSTFISGEGQLASSQEAAKLESHLVSKNPLEIVVLRKKVSWANWEDVATNIKQQLRAKGFQGDVEVRFDAQEDLRIYRNNRWQNFVRAPITHMLSVLSGCGLLLWLPYLYCRSDVVIVESRFEIHVDIHRYWEMLSAGLDAEEGFRST